MTDRIKVFFCEPLAGGIGVASDLYTCGCGREFRKEQRMSRADWDGREREGSVACECGQPAKWDGGGFHPIYRRLDTGEEVGGVRSLPPGACYDATWYHDYRTGADGRSLVVILPTGDIWLIDSRASNCDKPDDHEHRCWVRHGRPEDGTLHVDKNGSTCGAGAGSISVPGYHGFLHDGHLGPC